jgi:arylsulfatase A-like enzyme
LPAIAHRILLAAITVALARALLVALKDEYLASGLIRLGVQSTSRHVLEGLAVCLIPVGVVAVVISWLSGQHQFRRVLWATLLAGAVASYLFVSFRMPYVPYYAPHFDGARAYAAHAGAALVALAGTSILAPRLRIPYTRVLSWAATLLVLLPAAVLHLGRTVDAAGGASPNLILISLDTLRADRLGCYGYSKPTSPEIDRFSRDAFVFTNAYSPESWTLPAHMSMLTSLYPTVHGVGEERNLPPGVPTLASTLSREGYATMAVVDVAHWMSPGFGFDRGFDLYRVMPDYAEIKVDGILSMIDDLDRRPFFIFAHFYDVHSDKEQLPYDSDPQDMESFAGWYDGDFIGCNERRECASELLFAMLSRNEVFEDEEREYISSLYDAGIRSLDRNLKVLFDGLEQRGLFNNSVILLTADHGEEFFEHGRPVHTQYFDECVKIPFILRLPGGRGGTSNEMVSLVDVMPTLLSFCGMEMEFAQGVSLAPLVSGGEFKNPRHHLLIDGREPLLGLRTQRWSLVPTQGRLAGFDSLHDPHQSNDLLAGDEPPEELSELRALLDRESDQLRTLRDRFGPGEAQEYTEEELEQLRSLGYVGD